MEHESAVPPWDVLTAELRAYRQQQKQTWGDVDSVLMGRYLAGEATAEERHRVEASFDKHPDLRILADLVRDVLGEGEPGSLITSVQGSEPETNRPRLLPFSQQPKMRRPLLVQLRRKGVLVAAACLLLALGVTLVSQPLPAVATLTNNDWGTFQADRNGDRNEPFFVSRDAKFAAPRSFRLSSSGQDPDAPPAHSLALLVSSLEKAQQHRSDESIKEVALGVESYLTRVSSETDARTTSFAVPSAVAADPVPGARTFAAARTTVRSFAAKKTTGGQPAQVLEEAARVLAYGLERDDRPELQQKCCEALVKLGPVAQRAAPKLQRVARNASLPVRGQAETALRFVNLPCGSAGVNDIAEVLADQPRQRVDRHIQRLCRKYHLCFVAETVRCVPDETTKIVPVVEEGTREQAIARWAEVRRRQVGAQDGIYLLLCEDPPTVHVALGKDVKAKVLPSRLTEQSLRGVLCTHRHDKDKGLEKAVLLVEHELSRTR
jgi:hypothetical protein